MTTGRQKEWTIPQLIYAIMVGVLLLDYLVIQALDHMSFPYPIGLVLLRAITAIAGLWIGKLWKDKGFLMMLIIFLIQIIRLAFSGVELLFDRFVSDHFLNGVWVIAGCYSLGKILSTKQLKTYCKVLSVLWVTGALIHCIIAIYAACTDHVIYNPDGELFWGIDSYTHRLYMSYCYQTVAGSMLNISGMIAIFTAISSHSKGLRLYASIAYLVFILCLSLTDARTSFVSASLGAGAVTYILIKKTRHGSKRNILSEPYVRKKSINPDIIALAGMITVSVIIFMLIIKIAPVFNYVKTHQAGLVSVAYGEAAEQSKIQVISRGFSGLEALSGREIVWKTVIRYLVENPLKLLFGESVYNPMAGLNQLMDSPMGHCHNFFLHMLLENGIVGLLPIICLIIYTTKNSIYIIRDNTVPMWPCIFSAIGFSVMIGDLTECFIRFEEWKGPALPFLFLSMGIINSIAERNKSEKTIIPGFS